MQIHSPNPVTHLLLENPWPMSILLLAVAVGLFIDARRRQDRGRLFQSVAAMFLSGLVPILAGAVETRREQLIRQTHDLVDATAPLDIAALRPMFHPWAVLSGPDGSAWLDRRAIDDRLSAASSGLMMTTQQVLAVDADTARESGRSLLTLRTWPGAPIGDRGVETQWMITWQPDPNDPSVWRIGQVQWLRLNGDEPGRQSMNRLRP